MTFQSFIILALVFFSIPCIGKNDTIVISDMNQSIRFDAIILNIFCTNAKHDIREIKSADEKNYKLICGSIKHLIQTERTCNHNDIISILKHYGSLSHFLHYKKMFHIYCRQINGLKTWANQV